MEPTVVVDEQIGQTVLSVLHTAKKEVVLVSPWIKLWGHAQGAIRQARTNGIRVLCLVREGDGGAKKDDVQDLLDLGADVRTVSDLHAKIYLNETLTVISSMNFHNHSVANSHEIAVVIRDPASQKAVRDYVHDRLLPIAHPWTDVRGPASRAPAGQPGRQSGLGALGTCVRCGRKIGLDPSRPLCDPCYERWAEWQDADYPENYCHACGTVGQPVSYARPLCRKCFRSL